MSYAALVKHIMTYTVKEPSSQYYVNIVNPIHVVSMFVTFLSVLKATLVEIIRMYSSIVSFSILKHQNISNIKEITGS